MRAQISAGIVLLQRPFLARTLTRVSSQLRRQLFRQRRVPSKNLAAFSTWLITFYTYMLEPLLQQPADEILKRRRFVTRDTLMVHSLVRPTTAAYVGEGHCREQSRSNIRTHPWCYEFKLALKEGATGARYDNTSTLIVLFWEARMGRDIPSGLLHGARRNCHPKQAYKRWQPVDGKICGCERKHRKMLTHWALGIVLANLRGGKGLGRIFQGVHSYVFPPSNILVYTI